jgi:hypothetical protein
MERIVVVIRRAVTAAALVALVTFAREAWAEGQEPRGPAPTDAGAEVGMHGGQPYFRAQDDALRVYPHAAVTLDASWSSGPAEQDSDRGGARGVIRSVRLGVGAELFRLLALEASLELGGGRIGETRYAGSRTPRWAPAEAHDGELRLGDVTASFTPARWLGLTAGWQAVPFSMSNRTPDAVLPFFERPLAIRGFAVPERRALGLTVWGETDARAFAYELGLFRGEADLPGLEGNADVWGRFFARPFTSMGKGVFFELAQVGASWRLGTRASERLDVDFPALATDHGLVLRQPGHVEDFSRVVNVVPSDRQSAIGGELRLPIRTPTNAVFDLHGEAYYVNDGTRESTKALGTDETLRRGTMEGVAWYASLTWWACFIPGFDQLVTGEPGITRPTSLDDDRVPVPNSALDASILVGGVHATYDPASRGGAATEAPPTDVTVYQLGGVVDYRLGANVRAGVSYLAYLAPTEHEVGLRLYGGF